MLNITRFIDRRSKQINELQYILLASQHLYSCLSQLRVPLDEQSLAIFKRARQLAYERFDQKLYEHLDTMNDLRSQISVPQTTGNGCNIFTRSAVLALKQMQEEVIKIQLIVAEKTA